MFLSCSNHEGELNGDKNVQSYGKCNNGARVIAFQSDKQYEAFISTVRQFKLNKTVHLLYDSSKLMHPTKIDAPCRKRFKYFEHLIAEMSASSIKIHYENLTLSIRKNPYPVIRNFIDHVESTSEYSIVETTQPIERETVEELQNLPIRTLPDNTESMGFKECIGPKICFITINPGIQDWQIILIIIAILAIFISTIGMHYKKRVTNKGSNAFSANTECQLEKAECLNKY